VNESTVGLSPALDPTGHAGAVSLFPPTKQPQAAELSWALADWLDGANLVVALVERHAGLPPAELLAHASARTGGNFASRLTDPRLADLLPAAERAVKEKNVSWIHEQAGMGEGVGALVVLAVVLVVILRARRSSSRPSAAFAQISQHVGEAWADQLLVVGAPATWSLAEAWAAARLDDAARAQAIEVLVELPPFQAISVEAGAAYDAAQMRAARGDGGWVVGLLRVGLAEGTRVIEPALVRLGSPDALALARLADEPVTRKLRERMAGAAERLTSGWIAELELVYSAPELDAWLRRVAQAAPPGTLELVAPEPGEAFIERDMRSETTLRITSRAVVTERLRLGLRRRGEDAFHRASVRAREPERT
jgi:hypothetical protein